MAETPRQTVRRLAQAGYTDDTTRLSLQHLSGLDSTAAGAECQRFLDELGIEASEYDVLGGLMLNVRQRAALYEDFKPHLKQEKVTASAFNTARGLLKDQRDTALEIFKLRKETGRDRCIPPETAKQQEEERQRSETRLWEHQELTRDKGYYYIPGLDMEQPGSCLDEETMAIRDALRFRHLPKSPYEDRILAEAYGATFPEEKDIDPESLSKEERPTDLHTRVAEAVTQGPKLPWGKYSESQDAMLSRLTAERLRVQNAVQAQAEAVLDEVDRRAGRWACSCCRSKVPQPSGWLDEPAHLKKHSMWRGEWNVVVKSLLWPLLLGWLLAQQLVGGVVMGTTGMRAELDAMATHGSVAMRTSNAEVLILAHLEDDYRDSPSGAAQPLLTTTNPVRNDETARPGRVGPLSSAPHRANEAGTYSEAPAPRLRFRVETAGESFPGPSCQGQTHQRGVHPPPPGLPGDVLGVWRITS